MCFHVDGSARTHKEDHEKEIPKVVKEEWEHARFQDSLGKELMELNILLEKKEVCLQPSPIHFISYIFKLDKIFWV